MRTESLIAEDVDGAREEILRRIQTEKNFINKNNTSIYFPGWNGFGATAVLTSIAQVLGSRKDLDPLFGTTIYIDCTRWKSKRVMQRKIAQELKLDSRTMAMFDEQDEEDDFNGVDPSSRDVIPDVAAATFQKLARSRFTMVFLNGSDEEISLARFGISEYQDCIIIWTFSTRFLVTDEAANYWMKDKLRYTDIHIWTYLDAYSNSCTSRLVSALFREEAAAIVARYPCMRDNNLSLAVATDCYLYGLLIMYHSCYRGFVWPAHAPSYWVCDGIIQGDRAWEISNALHPEITFKCSQKDRWFDRMLVKFNEDPEIPFLVVTDGDGGGAYEKKPCCRWISVTFKNNKKLHKGMQLQTIFARASSIFLAFETYDSPCGRLPDGIFKQCTNLGVLVLSRCAFSFISPPFLHCHTLRFLGLEHCINNNNAAEGLEEGDCATIISSWEFLKSMWVIELYYTDWTDILSKEMVQHMASLIGLNIEGVRLPRWISRDELQKRLPYLRQLRIIKPIEHDDEVEETIVSSDISDSFVIMESTSLEILDLSGCQGLEDVVLSDNSSLKSFSLDGYGLASSRQTSPSSEHPPILAYKKQGGGAKTSTISLDGCSRLDKLFLRGLPNLMELDLSGCMIRVLNLGAMVVDAPGLKRLFLLGCEQLGAIKWGSHVPLISSELRLELICIDTRPGTGSSRRLLAQPPAIGSSQQQWLKVYAVMEDARLARSLFAPINKAPWSGRYFARYFNISITSSPACSDGVAQQTGRIKETTMIGSSDQRRYYATDVLARRWYADVFTMVDDGSVPMQAFPQASTNKKDCHIEIGAGSRSVHKEVANPPSPGFGNNLASLMSDYTQSLHVHDVSDYTNTMPAARWYSLRWCRVERCPNLHTVFPPDSEDPNLGYALPISMLGRPSLPSLESLHIIHCGDLRHIFVPGNKYIQHRVVEFPKLTTIHLHDLPALQQICEGAEMLAPALETIKIRGCWSLRQLPSLKGRESGTTRVEVEKDVWDALQRNGVDVGHLYEAPVHSRYYKRRMLRGTVLR